MMEDDQKLGLYEVYGDTKEDLVENNLQKTEVSGKIPTLEEEMPVTVENNLQNFDEADYNKDGIVTEEERREWYENEGWKDPYMGGSYFLHPWFDWNKKERWINDRNAINYWIAYGGGNHNALKEMQRSLKS
jgi:hypothetical protein